MAEEKVPTNILTDLDLKWSSGYQRENVFSNYYDYYFSGEDIKVYIDGLFEAEDELDIVSFAYSVRQEKQPLYGFWSYNYDAMMYGTRIISGEITIYSRYPQRMTNLLKKASYNRTLKENKKINQRVISKVNQEDESLFPNATRLRNKIEEEADFSEKGYELTSSGNDITASTARGGIQLIEQIKFIFLYCI